jgi:dienelactone hydrolase
MSEKLGRCFAVYPKGPSMVKIDCFDGSFGKCRMKPSTVRARALRALFGALLLAGCQTAASDPPVTGAQGPTAQGAAANAGLASALQVALPPGASKAPVVLMLEGTGGSNRVPPNWAAFLNARGIAAVQIRSAAARGRTNWFGTGCELRYGGDVRAALAVLADWPEIDVSRFAIMGFSRGGTEAMGAGRTFAGAAQMPAAVFAFYPGCGGQCATDWPLAAAQVPVHIFYGAADMWGAYQGTRGACRAQARGTVAYHEYAGAHHGFDSPSQGTFEVAGSRFRYEPNQAALEAAQAVVAETLARQWGTPH